MFFQPPRDLETTVFARLPDEYRRASPQRFAAELTGAAETLERLGEQAVQAQRELGSAAEAVRDTRWHHAAIVGRPVDC